MITYTDILEARAEALKDDELTDEEVVFSKMEVVLTQDAAERLVEEIPEATDIEGSVGTIEGFDVREGDENVLIAGDKKFDI